MPEWTGESWMTVERGAVSQWNDQSGNANHAAILYWGKASTLYDDNVHGAGVDPGNPGTKTTGYYERAKSPGGANWLEDGQPHGLRLEIHRTSSGAYHVLVWIDPRRAAPDTVGPDHGLPVPCVQHCHIVISCHVAG